MFGTEVCRVEKDGTRVIAGIVFAYLHTKKYWAMSLLGEICQSQRTTVVTLCVCYLLTD
jgi:hypothetical protein